MCKLMNCFYFLVYGFRIQIHRHYIRDCKYTHILTQALANTTNLLQYAFLLIQKLVSPNLLNTVLQSATANQLRVGTLVETYLPSLVVRYINSLQQTTPLGIHRLV